MKILRMLKTDSKAVTKVDNKDVESWTVFRVTMFSGDIGVGLKINGQTFRFEKTEAKKVAKHLISLSN